MGGGGTSGRCETDRCFSLVGGGTQEVCREPSEALQQFRHIQLNDASVFKFFTKQRNAVFLYFTNVC